MLKGFNFAKMLVIAFAVLACVGMWGCGYEWGEIEFLDTYNEASVVGFIDDSLVIVYDNRSWTQETGDYAIGGVGHQRLRIFNYRVQENGPRWIDSLDNLIDDFDYVKGQLSDSVIWGGDPNSTISFWKIGKKPYQMSVTKKYEGCSIDSLYFVKMRTWIDGKFLMLGEHSAPSINGLKMDSLGADYCQYAVLDTNARTITYKRLDKELAWLRYCDDVRAWSKDVYCLLLDKNEFNAYLLVNSEIRDSMAKDSFQLNRLAETSFIGNYLNINQKLCSVKDERIERLVHFKRYGISFDDEKGNYITY